MAVAGLNQAEEAQLQQTIEMFEIIIQSQPNDCQSLEILKEAYTKLGREEDVIRTSKHIAEAYTEMGQLSSAILEYETVLQRRPGDADVQKALKKIEAQAGNAVEQHPAPEHPAAEAPPKTDAPKAAAKTNGELDDGRIMMRKIFVDTRTISTGDFDLCWHPPDLSAPPPDVIEPFIQSLHDKRILTLDRSLKLLVDRCRAAYLPLERYDTDMDLLRKFPPDVCRRWCVAPFDRMSKSILVATANPFNQEAARELAESTNHRLIWYLAQPTELITVLRAAFR
ncbi:MAG: hypothetical protein KGR98_02485 [Verrucomicrobia bacterium]|nr:hypothetical protein [Verrucomicrobiota bacterium]MDE3098686.1 hypothetical protein [Verrucomicrobiota bacterium]